MARRRSLAQLLSPEDAWPVLQEWMAKAGNGVRSLPIDREDGERTLEALQVSVASPLGAIALHTGGLSVDQGWLTVLGAGPDLGAPTNLGGWNGLREAVPHMLARGFTVVGHDALGGLFAMNGGAFPVPRGELVYFAPERLQWLPLQIGYGDWLAWALDGDLGEMYAPFRWSTWRSEVAALGPGRVLAVDPPLCRPGPSIGDRRRTPTDAPRLWEELMALAESTRGAGSPR